MTKNDDLLDQMIDEAKNASSCLDDPTEETLNKAKNHLENVVKFGQNLER